MTVWVLITSGSLAANIVTLMWAYEVQTTARHEKKVSEQQRRILKEWMETILSEFDEEKRAGILAKFSRVNPGPL